MVWTWMSLDSFRLVARLVRQTGRQTGTPQAASWARARKRLGMRAGEFVASMESVVNMETLVLDWQEGERGRGRGHSHHDCNWGRVAGRETPPILPSAGCCRLQAAGWGAVCLASIQLGRAGYEGEITPVCRGWRPKRRQRMLQAALREREGIPLQPDDEGERQIGRRRAQVGFTALVLGRDACCMHALTDGTSGLTAAGAGAGGSAATTALMLPLLLLLLLLLRPSSAATCSISNSAHSTPLS
ncbi:hypothetical protein BS50DRAFT_338009 [Corynespora cassiicola Philippines]|uniref:Uncharacterized protein n=1 Tax=Corynespora cassiicola Philippines TaxID=1448308 RepID=A0A2T2NV08_CORCC|nr:hypothetical protein BS50DRAFT_338009 [Corynespora cassiicola Philippines]